MASNRTLKINHASQQDFLVDLCSLLNDRLGYKTTVVVVVPTTCSFMKK